MKHQNQITTPAQLDTLYARLQDEMRQHGPVNVLGALGAALYQQYYELLGTDADAAEACRDVALMMPQIQAQLPARLPRRRPARRRAA